MNRTAMVGMVLVTSLIVPLTGCATKGKVSASKICAAAGGKYSLQTATCDAPALVGRKASDMCQAHGGYYDPAAQVCEVGID